MLMFEFTYLFPSSLLLRKIERVWVHIFYEINYIFMKNYTVREKDINFPKLYIYSANF